MKKLGCLSIVCYLFLTNLQAKQAMIQGEEIVEIAVQGESIAVYTAPKNYIFSISKNIKGVRMTKDGILHINMDAKEGMITLSATNKQKVIKKQVKLITSWTKKVQGAQQYQIPNIHQTRRITLPSIQTWLPDSTIRILFVGGALFVSIGYLLLRRKKGS